jgi:putative endonuclease
VQLAPPSHLCAGGDPAFKQNRTMKKKTFYVYILASKWHGTLYVGMTNDLVKRIEEHKERMHDGFTSKYNVDQLVYYESYEKSTDATTNEKRLKKWNRQWKINLIEEHNPDWNDLSKDF